jgi:hypothetical protein
VREPCKLSLSVTEQESQGYGANPAEMLKSQD